MNRDTVTPLNGYLTSIDNYFDDNEDQLGRLVSYTIASSLIDHKINTVSEKHRKYEQMRLLYIDLEKTIEECKKNGIIYNISELKKKVDPFIEKAVEYPELINSDAQPLLSYLITYLKNPSISINDNFRRLGIIINNEKKYGTLIKKNKTNVLEDYNYLENILKQ